MSDRETSSKRKYLLLLIPVLLLLGWFVFAPGDDPQNAGDKKPATSQKQKAKDDSENTEGQVSGAFTTEPVVNTTTSTWKPSPNVKLASVTTGTTPTPTTPQPQQPTTPDDQEEPTEPECEIYDGQIITIAPGESSDCYILANENEALGCWVPFWPHAFDDVSDPVFLGLDALPIDEVDFPYLVVENKSMLEDEDLPVELCPASDTYLQFHVRAPQNILFAGVSDMDYNFIFPVLNINGVYMPGEESFDETLEPEFTCHNIYVRVLGDELPVDSEMMIDCALLEEEILGPRPV